jgi:hypothetical protein
MPIDLLHRQRVLTPPCCTLDGVLLAMVERSTRADAPVPFVLLDDIRVLERSTAFDGAVANGPLFVVPPMILQ